MQTYFNFFHRSLILAARIVICIVSIFYAQLIFANKAKIDLDSHQSPAEYGSKKIKILTNFEVQNLDRVKFAKDSDYRIKMVDLVFLNSARYAFGNESDFANTTQLFKDVLVEYKKYSQSTILKCENFYYFLGKQNDKMDREKYYRFLEKLFSVLYVVKSDFPCKRIYFSLCNWRMIFGQNRLALDCIGLVPDELAEEKKWAYLMGNYFYNRSEARDNEIVKSIQELSPENFEHEFKNQILQKAIHEFNLMPKNSQLSSIEKLMSKVGQAFSASSTIFGEIVHQKLRMTAVLNPKEFAKVKNEILSITNSSLENLEYDIGLYEAFIKSRSHDFKGAYEILIAMQNKRISKSFYRSLQIASFACALSRKLNIADDVCKLGKQNFGFLANEKNVSSPATVFLHSFELKKVLSLGILKKHKDRFSSRYDFVIITEIYRLLSL